MEILKTVASYLPGSVVQELKRWRFRRQARAGRFVPDEPEIAVITQEVRGGDFVIDVGANIGHYTMHLSACVGPSGRVLSFEPMPETFALLAATVEAARAMNVTLLNIAASSAYGIVAMDMPKLPNSGLDNYYQATIGKEGRYRVMCMAIDSLELPKVNLIKIDAEQHDWEVLKGAEKTILRDRPVLIVESRPTSALSDWLRERGYEMTRIGQSPNIVGRPVPALRRLGTGGRAFQRR